MIDAPTDGTRVLIKAQCHKWAPEKHGSAFRILKPAGHRWVECSYLDGRWQEWGGYAGKVVNSTITPLAWAPLPEDEQQ